MSQALLMRPGLGGLVTTWAGPLTLLCFMVICTSVWLLAIRVRRVKAKGHMSAYAAGALRYAAARGNLRALAHLAARKDFEVDASHDGWTALLAACVCGQAAAVRWLLERGANVHQLKTDGWGDTALHYAAGKGWADVCVVLLAFGADPCRTNFHGATPLDLATAAGNDAVCAVLQSLYNPQRLRQQLSQMLPPPKPEPDTSLDWVTRRRWDSYGSPGTVPYPHQTLTRLFVVLAVLIGILYAIWRAARTMNATSVYSLVFSVTVYMAELFMLAQFYCSIILMWQPITREERDMYAMGIPEELWPTVDIFVVTYSEPVTVVEPTVYAALNQMWPETKLHVHIMDDGKRPEMQQLHQRIQQEIQQAGRAVSLSYVARPKVKGVHHHAKAGNINHTLTKEACSKADFVLILDCDMITLPNFLRSSMPHFFECDVYDGRWRLKEKAAMLQLPQRFMNLGPKDPWWHTAEDFNAAGFEGTDGVGATPCVGTGVIFRRECLVAIGGQSYWSITEDFKTSFNLLAQGYSTMYLARNLVFGLAVDDIPGIRKQRTRWASGGLQILAYDSPLFRNGLGLACTVLFFANAWQYALSGAYTYITLTPIIYFWSDVSPVRMPLTEAGVFIGTFILFTRCLQWWQVRLVDVISKDLCLWRGSQQVVWLTPLFLESLVTFIWNEFLSVPLRRLMRAQKKTVAFVVSAKDVDNVPWDEILKASWFVWLFYILTALGIVFNFSLAAGGAREFDRDFWLHFIVGLILCSYVLLMLFPYLAVLLPCTTNEYKGLVEWVPRQLANSPDPDYQGTITEEEQAYFTCWGSIKWLNDWTSPIVKPKYHGRMRTGGSSVDLRSVQLAPSTLAPASAVMSSDTQFSHDSRKTLSQSGSITIVLDTDSLEQEHLMVTQPALDRSPCVHLPPYITKHYKFRIVAAIMIITTGVGLPLLGHFVFDDVGVLQRAT